MIKEKYTQSLSASSERMNNSTNLKRLWHPSKVVDSL